MKTKIHLILLIPALLFIVSCNDNTADPYSLPAHEMDAIENRIDQFTRKKRLDCIDKALELANARVDSTLLQMEILIPIDVQGNIPRPQRPATPIKREKVDTTAIQPFIPSPRDSH